MCNLCRISINCLLLISIVSAVPLGRHKRDISFFKDLFKSTFYGTDGRTLQIPDVRVEPDCMIYIVPGYSDILPQPIETEDDEIVIPYEGKKERRPYPIKTHVSTKNFEDRDESIHYMHKLPEATSRMHDSAVSRINGHNARKFVVEENIIPDPVITKKIQSNRHGFVPSPRRYGRVRTVNFDRKYLRTIPVLTETVEQLTPEKLASNRRMRLLQPVEPNYLPKLIERPFPIIRFSPRRYPVAKHRENFVPIPRIDDIIPWTDDEYHIVPPIGNHYFYSRHQFMPSETQYYVRNIGGKYVPLNSKLLPLVDSDNHEVINKHLSNKNKIHKKIAPDENDTSKPEELRPKIYHSLNRSTTDNITTNVFHEQKGKINSRKDHNYSKAINIAKEKDEIETPLTNITSVKNITPIIAQTKDKNLNVVKTGDNLPKSKTLAQYINELVRDNKTHIVDIQKFKDEVQTYCNTDLTNFTDIDTILDIVSKNLNNSNITIPFDKLKDLRIPNDNVDITHVVDVNNNGNSNIITPDIKIKDKTDVFKPTDVTFSKEMPTLINRTNLQPLSEVENRDDAQAIVKNSPIIIDTSEAKTDDDLVKSEVNNKTVTGQVSAGSQNISPQNNQRNEKNNTKSKNFTISKDDASIQPIPVNSSNYINLPDKIIKMIELVPKDISSSQNIYDSVNYSTPSPLNEMEDRDNLKVNNNLVKSNENAKSEDSSINLVDKVSNNSKYIDSQLGEIIFNLLNLLEENHEPKTNINTYPTLWNQNISFSHIIDNLSPVLNNSNIKEITGNNTQNVNIASDEKKIKTNVVTNSPLSVDNDYMQAITNTPPINYTENQISNGKKETVNTENTTDSSKIKLPLGDTKNDQISSEVATDDAPAVQQNKINDSSTTVNDSDEKSNNIRETTISRGDIPEASF